VKGAVVGGIAGDAGTGAAVGAVHDRRKGVFKKASGQNVKQFRQTITRALIAGILFVLPVYLAILLLLKAAKSLGKLVHPITRLLPKSFPAEDLLSVLLVLVVCLLVGLALRTSLGEAARTGIENSLLVRIPGYGVLRSMTHQMAGDSRENAWKPALAEIEDALVPAFIVEELDDGRFTVFVPSVPTPLAGAIYILTASRVHPVNVPFTQAVQAITRWGSGSRELVAAMQASRLPSLGLK
jgi:uncharacterized membrane protein